MPHNLARITAAGFRRVGCWSLKGDRLEYLLDPDIRSSTDVLYAFVVDGALMYVGKTSRTITDRLQRYKTPAKNALSGGSTNIKNNANISRSLSTGSSVDIYLMAAPREERHGEFKLNFAAALEDSLISELRPPWNGSGHRARLSAQNRNTPVTQPAQAQVPPGPILGISAERFRGLLRQAFQQATSANATHVDIQSGELHRQAGGYPARGHSMPTCCSVMRQERREGDEILAEPPKGRGATLRIRYRLPRSAAAS